MYYRVWVFIRSLIILAAVAAIVGAVVFRISEDDYANTIRLYNGQLTVVVGTSVANALNNATRTAEAPLKQYRLVTVAQGEALADVAEEFNTTLEIVQRVNGLAPDVLEGDGSQLIIPQGVTVLDPPRRLIVHTAGLGDTFDTLAQQYDVPLRMLQTDNPVLATRPLIPGDIVFVAQF